MKLLYLSMKCFIAAVAILILLTIKSFACVAWSSNAKNHIFNTSLNDTFIQRDAPIGSTILTKSVSTGLSSSEVFAECFNGDRGHFSLQSGILAAGYNDVYETSIPGVGIKVKAGTSSFYYTNPASQNGPAHDGDGWAWNNWGTSFEITLIKTGPIVSGDISGTTAIFSLDGLGDMLTLNINSGKITALTCTIKTPSIRAPLGNVLNTNFTGVGSTPKSYDFEVGLDCDADANINVSLDGTQSKETNDPSVLALTDAGQPDVASGVGVQIIYSGTPLKLNENIVMGKATGGMTMLPLTARYYQTKSVVKNGSANATATLNITYQ